MPGEPSFQEVSLYVEQEGTNKFKIQSGQLEQIGAQLRGRREFSIFQSIILPLIVSVATIVLSSAFQYVSWFNSVGLKDATDVADKAERTYETSAAAIGRRHYATLVFLPSLRDLVLAKANAVQSARVQANGLLSARAEATDVTTARTEGKGIKDIVAAQANAKKRNPDAERLLLELKGKLADSFEERFGVRPMEGYGATELAPVITLSLPDVEVGGVRQYGSKEGSVGHPIPGVVIRVVDPESGTELKPGEAGLMLVKGPNVMLGYLGRPDKTAEAVRDGWYVTGDIGIMDEDGFIRITDRLSRFSKIGGEMVPHGAVEDELHARLGQQQVVAVTSIPDEKRGERLVVLYTKGVTDSERLHKLMGESPLPNLWKPGKECYLEVEELPILGTGKLDLKEVREIALVALGGS